MAKTLKEYLSTGAGTQGTLLIPRKIYDTLWEAVQKNLIGRKHAAWVEGPQGVPGSSLDVNLVTADSMKVQRIAEGAEIPVDTVEYTTLNVRPSKYGVRPLITKEMIEDSKFNLIDNNVYRAGIEMAENEDSLIVTALDGAANTVSGGAAITIANITRAMQYLEDSDFKPRAFFVGPEVANDLRNIDTFVEAQKAGLNRNQEMFENGLIGKIFGMDVYEISGNIITSTSSYVVDSEQAFCVVEKRPVTMEEYDDKTKDISGVVVTQRVAVALLRSSAVAKITTT